MLTNIVTSKISNNSTMGVHQMNIEENHKADNKVIQSTTDNQYMLTDRKGDIGVIPTRAVARPAIKQMSLADMFPVRN